VLHALLAALVIHGIRGMLSVASKLAVVQLACSTLCVYLFMQCMHAWLPPLALQSTQIAMNDGGQHSPAAMALRYRCSNEVACATARPGQACVQGQVHC
jgi:hypothetical protein